MRRHTTLALKILILFILGNMSNRIPNDQLYRIAYVMFFYAVAVALLSKETQSIPVNMTLAFKDKKPPHDDKDDFSKNVVLEI